MSPIDHLTTAEIRAVLTGKMEIDPATCREIAMHAIKQELNDRMGDQRVRIPVCESREGIATSRNTEIALI